MTEPGVVTMQKTMGRLAATLLAVAAVVAGGLVSLQDPAVGASADEVLVYGPTVRSSSSLEIQTIESLGLKAVIVDEQTWSSMTTSDFAKYRAIVFGDTGGNAISTFQTAVNNASVWGAAVSANQLIIGTDPADHASSGGQALIQKGIAFAADVVGKTGLYVTLGDAYSSVAAGTPIPLLDGIGGGFTAQGASCHNDAHIVAEHQAVDGLTDASLSGWSCSVHNQFDAWPARFQVLAIARNSGSVFTGPDGSVGVPYILAAGDGLKSFPLSASPTYAEVGIGKTHTITGELLDKQTRKPVKDALLRAALETRSGSVVVLSPLGCSTALCKTGANGTVDFRYSSNVVRSDTVVVWRDADNDNGPDVGEEQVRVQVEWTAPTTSSNKPVLMVHGIDPYKDGAWSGNCDATFGDLKRYLRKSGFGDRALLTIGYYADDNYCDANINSSVAPGIGNSYFDGKGAHEGNAGGHTGEAAIEHLGYHFAWWIYNTYTSRGISVDVVGHSMGGLITRFALGKVQNHASEFPPKLLIDDVVTLGTPNGGSRPGAAWGPLGLFGRGCGHRQCSQMVPGDGFLKSLEREAWNPQGATGTDWTSFGSDGDDAVSADRAVGTNRDRNEMLYFGGCHKVWYAANFGHSQYMHFGANGGPSNYVVYDNEGRCGVPLTKHGGQAGPVPLIARALNSSAY